MNAIVVQCGGPTPVINATLAAIIAGWQRSRAGRIFGARWGLHGFAHHNWVELSELTEAQLATLAAQPGAALGSGRHRLADDDLALTLDSFRDGHIGYVFMIGGNGTMGAALRLLTAAIERGYDVLGQPLRVIGAPKTIDNDLTGVDCAPGYGSAARYIAQTTRDVSLDLVAMTGFDQVAVIETMGRHTGWLAAASALARTNASDPPHLILAPETPVDEEVLVAAITAAYAAHGVCLIVASEGIRDGSGRFYAEKLVGAGKDASGQTLLSLSGGVAAYLARLLQSERGLRCRQIRLDAAQRATTALASQVDRRLARQVGAAAVEAALAGHSGVMVGLARTGGEWSTTLIPLGEVVGRERKLPPEFLAPERFDVTTAFLDYCAPLVGPLELNALRLWR